MNQFTWQDWVLGSVAVLLYVGTWFIYPTAGLMASISFLVAMVLWTLLPPWIKGLCAAFRLLSDGILSYGVLSVFGGLTLGGIIGAGLVAIGFSLVIKLEQHKQNIFGWGDFWAMYLQKPAAPKAQGKLKI